MQGKVNRSFSTEPMLNIAESSSQTEDTLLESTYNGTSVAVGMPEKKGDGEFAVYISVYQVGTGKAEVVPKRFSALYSEQR